MSTYLPGVTDYIPQIQPFKPDFNFYAGALQMKQTQYDTAHKQLSNLYGSLLNAPMIREGNIQAREDYFKAIDGEIKKISNLDLSQQQNVDSATALFSGLYENENIVKDMVWTKNYQGQVQRGEGFRNCLDPAKCGGSYWEGGMKALSYKAEEFKNATDEQALGFGNARYTPYQNVMEKAIKIANDAGLSITQDTLQGGYIVTTKNGPALIDPLNSLFTGMLANDPGVMDYYKTKAYVDRKDWVQGNIPVYGSQEAAEMAYIDQVSTGLQQMLTGAQADVDFRASNLQGQKKQLEERIRTEGANPNGLLAEQYRALNDMETQVVTSQQTISEANKTYQNAVDPAMRAYMGENLDGAMASYLLSGDIGAAATTLAYKDHEQTLKVDPYAMEAVQQSNRMALENVKFENSKLLEQYKYDVKAFEEKKAAMGSDVDNVPLIVKNTVGGADANLAETGGYDVFKEQQGQVQKDLSGGEKKLTTEMMSLTQQQSKNEGGKGIASDDLVQFGNKLFEALINTETTFYNESKNEYISNAQTAKANKALYDKWNNMTNEQKVQFAQKQDFNNLVNHSGISGTVLDGLYNDFVKPNHDFTNASNIVNRSYLAPMWTAPDNVALRNNITSKNAILEGMGSWYTSESQRVLQDMKSGTFAEYAPVMQMYINPETGAKRSAPEFAKAYAEAAVQTEGISYEEGYQAGLAVYTGEEPLSTFERVAYGTLGAAGGLVYALTAADSSTSLDTIWAQAFSKYGRANGQELTLGLLGSDSYASQGMRFPVVDPVKYSSGAVTNTLSFFQDALRADGEQVKYSFGAPSAGLPEESNPEMQQFLSQLFGDMINRKDPKDESRPLLDVMYQAVAGSSDEWSALHVKMNHPYMKGFVGTEANPGPLFGMSDQLQNGFTVYLNDQTATNGFYKASQSSDVETLMHYTGEYKFDSYPEYTQNLKLKMNNAGSYVLTGNIMNGLDQQGNINWNPIHIPYDQLGSDPNNMISDINSTLAQIAIDNQQLLMNYNSSNSTRNPASLIQ